jgi:hypothetical protein
MKCDENMENTKCRMQQGTENAVENMWKCRGSIAEVLNDEGQL